MDEGLRRAEAYHAAGVDALLIHSKKRDGEEILTFAKEWANPCPLVSVPTTYSSTPTDDFRDAKFRWRSGRTTISAPGSPPCAKSIGGMPLLSRLTSTLNEGGIRDSTVVQGYKKSAINLPNLNFVYNDMFDVTGEVATLACARDAVAGPLVIAYGDILFRHCILDGLTEAKGDVVIVSDALWRRGRSIPRGSRPPEVGAPLLSDQR